MMREEVRGRVEKKKERGEGGERVRESCKKREREKWDSKQDSYLAECTTEICVSPFTRNVIRATEHYL